MKSADQRFPAELDREILALGIFSAAAALQGFPISRSCRSPVG
jgi:hypothetical protein